MPRRKNTVPSYRLHKASGLAVCIIEGRSFYLGKHDTKASREAYERLVLQWKAHGVVPRIVPRTELPITVAGLVLKYLQHIEQEGIFTKNGKPTSERYTQAVAFRPLAKLFGSKAAAEFSPLDLVMVRTALCDPMPPPQEGESGTGRWHTGPRARNSVNAHVRRIHRLFKWATSMMIVPAATWHALLSVGGLKRGQTNRARESDDVAPVSPRDVALVLRRVGPVVAACIRLQWLTGCRPGEVVQLRMRDIDRRAAVWVFKPQRHKTEHYGKSREVMLGPKAQRVLAPFLRLDADAFLFPGMPRKGAPGLSYSTGAYRKAIRIACGEAGVERWHPNRLRHSAASRFQRRHGIESARTVLGHSSMATTAIYAERDRGAAMEVAAGSG